MSGPSTSKTARPTPSPIVTTLANPPPRPLHLPNHVDDSSSYSSSSLSQNAPDSSLVPSLRPASADATSLAHVRSNRPSGAMSSTTNATKASRRQSSVSYLPPDSERYWRVRSPTAPTSAAASPSPSLSPGLNRSVSLSAVPQSRLKETKRSSFDPRNGSGSDSNSERATPALTLAEKHADLLQFIAQKESKCLELRSQLASHEAELLQLKQKWERIVNRDFGKALSTTYSPAISNNMSSNAAPTPSSNQGTGAVIDGLVEGVQGMGRLIAAGLASPGGPNSIPRGHARSSSSATSARPSSLGGKRVMNGHAAHNMSISSNSTATTTTSRSTSTSARLSQSSASSLGSGDEPILGAHKERDDESCVQELIVRDSGATPTLSPNPSFIRRHSQPSIHSTTTSSSSTISAVSPSTTSVTAATPAGGRMLRRRSRDATPLVSLEEAEGDAEPEFSKQQEMDKKDQMKTSRKRTSVNATAGIPQTPTSIPGMGSLSAIGSHPWLGTVGKKLEELQSGKTFQKGSKRASLLFSDVSQSFLHALSSPTSPPSNTPFASDPHFHTSSPLSSDGASGVRRQPSSISLMDDDDDGVEGSDLLGLGSVLTPDSTGPVTPISTFTGRGVKPTTVQPKKTVTTPLDGGGATKAALKHDDDDEWNW